MKTLAGDKVRDIIRDEFFQALIRAAVRICEENQDAIEMAN